MTYRSIHGTSPSYLQSCFTRVSDMISRRRLRSSTSHRLDVLPVRLSTVGRHAFPVSAATVWNDLPLYCNSLLYSISNGLLRRLQSVQNAAARLVTGTRPHEHITPVLRQLHWLPLCQRIQAGWVRVPVTCRPSAVVARRRLPSSVFRPSSSLF